MPFDAATARTPHDLEGWSSALLCVSYASQRSPTT